MRDYLIEVKKHHDSLEDNLKVDIGLYHFQKFVVEFGVKDYKYLASSFVQYLNGVMSLESFIKKVKIN